MNTPARISEQNSENDPERRAGWAARFSDWVFGYDFFLSYSHGDGMGYPRRLKDRLEQAGFRVFLDQTEYVAGIDLRRETKRQVTKSKRFVVIGRANALRSKWVKREVDVALAAQKTPVIIDINTAVDAAGPEAPVAVLAKDQHWLRLPEPLPDPDGIPSDHAVSELVRGFKFTHQEAKRVRVFATAAGILALTTAIAGWQAYEARISQKRAEAERDRAEQNFAAAKQAADGLVFDIAQGLRHVEGLRSQSVEIILERADKTLAQLQSSGGNAPKLVRTRAVLFNEFAKTYLRMGDVEKARQTAERSLRIAEDILSGPEGGSAQASGDVGAAQITLGDVARQTKKLEAARGNFEKAQSAYGTAAERAPGDVQWLRNSGTALNRLAQVSYWLGDLPRSRTEFEASLAIDRQLLAKDPSSRTDERSLAASLNNVGNVAQAQGDYAAAAGFFDEGVQRLRRAIEAEPTNTLLKGDLTTTLANAGDAQKSLGRLQEAQAAYDESLAVARAVSATDPGNAEWVTALTIALNKVGELAKENGEFAKARSAYEESLEKRRVLARDGSNHRRQRDLAVVLNKLGEVEMLTGRNEAARTLFLESLAIREQLAALDRNNTEWQTDVAMIRIQLGDLAKLEGNYTGALEAFRISLDLFRKLEAKAPDNEENIRLVSVALNRVGEAQFGAGDYHAARKSFDEALDMRRKLVARRPGVGSWQRDLSVSLIKVADTLVKLENKEGALPLHEECLKVRRELATGANASALQKTDLAEALWRLGEHRTGDERLQLLRQAHDLLEALEQDNRLSAEQKSWSAQISELLKP